MVVSVRLFATLRQVAGWKEKSFEVAEGATLGGFMAQLNHEQPELNLGQRIVYAAVNEDYVEADYQLKSGDRVAFFPPVSGGEELK